MSYQAMLDELRPQRERLQERYDKLRRKSVRIGLSSKQAREMGVLLEQLMDIDAMARGIAPYVARERGEP